MCVDRSDFEGSLHVETLPRRIWCACLRYYTRSSKHRSVGVVALCGLRTYEKTEAAPRRRLGGGVAGGAHHNNARWKVILHIGVSC